MVKELVRFYDSHLVVLQRILNMSAELVLERVSCVCRAK